VPRLDRTETVLHWIPLSRSQGHPQLDDEPRLDRTETVLHWIPLSHSQGHPQLDDELNLMIDPSTLSYETPLTPLSAFNSILSSMSVQTEPIEITSPIVLSADSNKDVNLPPTKKFQDNNKELGSVPQVPAEILSPSIAPTSTHPSTSSHLESQSSLSRADPTDANRMIEAVWEARMDAYISDRFA